ncbi:protein trichome birefringence-like 23 [Rosa rugosa]|uniref:protein trichome birefringence-like 23 n=1 Tax=Rosa rugosa TaxID=74645 RepID=UPI002B400B1E|nr:protein trichome birefringence-like 23 [Rosa rugosa]
MVMNYKHKRWIVKSAIAILLMGLVFCLFLSDSTEYEPGLQQQPHFPEKSLDSGQPISVPEDEDQDEIPLPKKAVSSEPPISGEEDRDRIKPPNKGKCNLFVGDWIPNTSGPIYNESCPSIESPQNCMKNGRPDTGFLYWKWSPRDCSIPKFEPEKFIEMMRNKHWALIGDSITRNHVQSLLCMLSTVERPIQVYHDKEYRSRRWHFPSYKFTTSVIWSPFLVKAAIYEDQNGVSTHEVELHLDKLDDKWIDQFQNFDYMIISTGKWFLKSAIYYENNEALGCHYCSQRNLTELGFDFAYRKTLRYVMNTLVASNHKGMIFFRTSTPDHFENGEWNTGGTCTKTAPVKEGEMELKEVQKILREIELEEFEKAATKASRNGVNLKLLDMVSLSLMRPDGHPGPYRQYHPFEHSKYAKVQTDCLHWCLPGPIDSWNDILMEMVVNG